jgi:hypothetical protein
MARKPYAMEQLLTEAQTIAGDIPKAVLAGEDGFGVYRDVLFTPPLAQKMFDLLEIANDERVWGVVAETDGSVRVQFVGDNRADDRTPFYLDAADAVLNEEQDDDEDDGGDSDPEPEPEDG